MDRGCFLQTERLCFSVWSLGDAALADALWGNEAVSKYIAGKGGFTRPDIQKRLALEIANQTKYQMQYWPVFLLEQGSFAGCCGLRPYRQEKKIFEIGFHFLPEYWGKGYGQEAARAVLAYGFEALGAREIVAGHHPANNASKRVLERLGFEQTGEEFYEPTGLLHPLYRRGI